MDDIYDKYEHYISEKHAYLNGMITEFVTSTSNHLSSSGRRRRLKDARSGRFQFPQMTHINIFTVH